MGNFGWMASASSNTYDYDSDFNIIMISQTDLKKLEVFFKKLSAKTKLDKVLPSQLFEYVNTSNSSLMEKIFSLSASNTQSPMDFKSFVYYLWNFCTMGSDSSFGSLLNL